MTGINAGTSAVSVMEVSQLKSEAACCGNLGLAHLWNGGDTPGTDFILFQSYGTGNGSTTGFCLAANTICVGIDLEGLTGSPVVDLPSNSAGQNMVLTGTFAGTGTNVFTEYFNNRLVWNASAPGQNTGKKGRLGAGGDLTHPGAIYFREGIYTNSVISSVQNAALFANVTAFYPALTFP